MSRLAPLVLVLFLAVPATAQEKPAPKPDPEPPAQPAKPATEDPMPEEEVDLSQAHWYRVRLVTGESMLGLAREGRLWEVLIRGSRWDPAEREAEGSGIRLWYVKRQLGYVFVPAGDVVGNPRDLGQASADDARRIREDRERAKARAKAARERAIEMTKRNRERLKQRRKGTGEDAQAEAGAKPEDFLTEPQKALLRKFPADKWSPNTPDKIQHRKVILGLFPTDEEKAFLEVFDKWKAAFDALEAATKKIEEAKAAAKAAEAQPKPASPEPKPSEGGTEEPKPKPSEGGTEKPKPPADGGSSSKKRW
jgi:hypothetical protein